MNIDLLNISRRNKDPDRKEKLTYTNIKIDLLT